MCHITATTFSCGHFLLRVSEKCRHSTAHTDKLSLRPISDKSVTGFDLKPAKCGICTRFKAGQKANGDPFKGTMPAIVRAMDQRLGGIFARHHRVAGSLGLSFALNDEEVDRCRLGGSKNSLLPPTPAQPSRDEMHRKALATVRTARIGLYDLQGVADNYRTGKPVPMAPSTITSTIQNVLYALAGADQCIEWLVASKDRLEKERFRR